MEFTSPQMPNFVWPGWETGNKFVVALAEKMAYSILASNVPHLNV